MLVLTRKQNETIKIGDSITITVVRTKGKTVRLGIDAPAEMSVLRGELVFDTSDVADDDDEEGPVATGRPRSEKAVAARNPQWKADAPMVAAPLRSLVKARAEQAF